MGIKAVIWDMDGVIVDSGPLHFKAWRELALEKGIKFTKSEFKKTFGMRNPDILKQIFGEITSEEIKYLAYKKEENFRRLAKLGIKPLPGVISLLNKLSEMGIKQAIASSTPLQNIKLIIDKLKISDFFEVIVSDEDVTQGKPNPETFLIAAKRLNVEPQNSMVIEDAVAGVIAAKRAGMKVIAVTNTVPREKLLLADLVVESLGELNLSFLEW